MTRRHEARVSIGPYGVWDWWDEDEAAVGAASHAVDGRPVTATKQEGNEHAGS